MCMCLCNSDDDLLHLQRWVLRQQPYKNWWHRWSCVVSWTAQFMLCMIFNFLLHGLWQEQKSNMQKKQERKKYEYVQKWSRRGKVTKFLGYMLQQSLGVYNMYIQYNVSKCVYVCVAVWILAHSAATFSHTYTTAPLWDSNCCGHHIRCMCVSGDRRWGRRQNGCCLCVSLCSGSF